MNGRQLLEVASIAAEDPAEEWQRTAAGRAYFAVFLESRDALLRWAIGRVPAYQAHAYVRTRFRYASHSDLKLIGEALDELYELRSRAEYITATAFASAFIVDEALVDAEDAIALLHAIDADAARRSAAVAAIRAIP